MTVPIVVMLVIIFFIIILMFLSQKLDENFRFMSMAVAIVAAIIVAIWGYQVFVQRGLIREANENCKKRIEELNEAVEKYNDSHIHMMEKLDIGKLSKTKPKLLKTNFFQTGDKKEFECRYHSKGDLTATGTIICDIHGDLFKIKLEIDKNK